MPVLGPVYSEKNIKPLLKALLVNSLDVNFLPYDKNIRWFKNKEEHILVDSICHTREAIEVVSKDSAGSRLDIYYYSTKALGQPGFDDLKNKYAICKDNRQDVFLHCFKRPDTAEEFAQHNIFFKKISKKDRLENRSEDIVDYFCLPQALKKTFSNVSQEEEHSGLKYFEDYFLKKGRISDPVLCALENSTIVGVIGPLSLSTDIFGNKFLQPPFFGVKKQSQNKGIGKKLWVSAISYALGENALYTLVQNKPGTSAANFYLEQGLKAPASKYTIKLFTL